MFNSPKGKGFADMNGCQFSLRVDEKRGLQQKGFEKLSLCAILLSITVYIYTLDHAVCTGGLYYIKYYIYFRPAVDTYLIHHF